MERLSGDERKQRILAAAAEVFAASGPEHLSVRRVAEVAGIGMGTLRYHFPRQKDLHNAVVLKLVDDAIEDFGIFDAQQPAARRLEECVRQFIPSGDEPAHLLDVWFGMYRVGLDPNGSPFAREFLEVSAGRARERMRQWLTQLAGEGLIPSAEVDYHAHRLLVLVNGICLELLTPGSELTVHSAQQLVSRATRATFVPEDDDDA